MGVALASAIFRNVERFMVLSIFSVFCRLRARCLEGWTGDAYLERAVGVVLSLALKIQLEAKNSLLPLWKGVWE